MKSRVEERQRSSTHLGILVAENTCRGSQWKALLPLCHCGRSGCGTKHAKVAASHIYLIFMPRVQAKLADGGKPIPASPFECALVAHPPSYTVEFALRHVFSDFVRKSLAFCRFLYSENVIRRPRACSPKSEGPRVCRRP